MFTVRKVVPALCLAVSMSGLAVYAATTTAPTSTGGHHWRGHHHHGFMGMVLHKLDLTAAQKAQVKSIMASEKSQFQTMRTSSQTNHDALASTSPTDTATYAGLVATEQKNAAARIQLQSETWSNVYSNVLTQTQRDAIPGVVAAAKARREQWQAEHAASGSSGG
jgi:Spy/CpxP family protein refolding chaperone